ncbi:hypothetical protein ACQ9WU_001325 [Escherichia coli]
MVLNVVLAVDFDCVRRS